MKPRSKNQLVVLFSLWFWIDWFLPALKVFWNNRFSFWFRNSFFIFFVNALAKTLYCCEGCTMFCRFLQVLCLKNLALKFPKSFLMFLPRKLTCSSKFSCLSVWYPRYRKQNYFAQLADHFWLNYCFCFIWVQMLSFFYSAVSFKAAWCSEGMFSICVFFLRHFCLRIN